MFGGLAGRLRCRRARSCRRVPAGVVLPGELRARAHLEVALLAAEPPGDRLRSRGRACRSPGCSGPRPGVAVRVLLDRVEVEVVPRAVSSASGCTTRRGRSPGRLCHSKSTLPLGPPAPGRFPPRPRRPRRDLAVDRDQRRAAVGEQELVDVARRGRRAPRGPGLDVRVVEDHVVALADPHRRFAAPPREHRLHRRASARGSRRSPGCRAAGTRRRSVLSRIRGPAWTASVFGAMKM